MRVLVIGCGYMGRIHSANLSKLGVEVIQYDVARERCNNYVDNVLDHPVDMIVIATPIETHYQVFSRMYEYYGKRVCYFIEKPVTATLEQFQEIVKIDGNVFVGHQLRYSKFYALIKSEINSRSNFEVYMMVHSPSHPGVGLILDTGIHFIDLPTYYLGPPRNFEVRGNKNSFNLILHYDRGVWIIKGELKDYYRIEFSVNEKQGISDGRSLTFGGNLFQDVDVYYEEMKDVVNYIRNRDGGLEKPRISLQNLIKTYELAFEIYSSLSQNQ
ncbi:MAG: Gfo/Idh/MocA family oxidoreductase [Thermosphaera sp.]